MINRHAADFVGFHCHFPAQGATMQVLFRGGSGCFDFRNVTERDYLSLHFTMSLNDSADLGGQDGATAITQESNVNAKLGEDSHSDKGLDWAIFLGNCVIFTSEAGWTDNLGYTVYPKLL
jgi:hypothetical protein